jgi:hypothetical protein
VRTEVQVSIRIKESHQRASRRLIVFSSNMTRDLVAQVCELKVKVTPSELYDQSAARNVSDRMIDIA